MQSRQIHLGGPLPMSRERAARLVSAANTFPCGVFLERDNFTVNAKSMLGLLSIHGQSSRVMMLVTDGAQEEEAMEVLWQLLSEEPAVEASHE
ncbi:MAG: phosphocarrier protein Chr [Clostridiales bacterium]|nr:phosphocarrier protein Chr [Clostridiales bacterium]